MALKASDIAKPVMINYKSKMLQGLGLCRESLWSLSVNKIDIYQFVFRQLYFVMFPAAASHVWQDRAERSMPKQK